MKKGKNICYYEKSKRPFVFEKKIGGKRISRRFKDFASAKKFAEDFFREYAEKGASAIFFGEADRQLLRDLRAIAGEGADLRAAVSFWKRHFKAQTVKSVGVETAAKEFVWWLKESGRSERHVESVQTTLRKFVSVFGARDVAAISAQDLLGWLGGLNLAARSKRNQIGNIMNFFNWCRVAKSWVLEVPRIDARLLPVIPRAPVAIWTVDAAEKALRWIEENEREYLPHFVLRLFAGLRTAEADKMMWDWIDFERRTISVPAEICKTRDAWIILPSFCPDTIWHWLEPWKGSTGKIKSPAQKAQARISHGCGCVPNVLRHTFATMHVAFYNDEGKTIMATRHTNIAMLRSNYRGVNQTKEDAERFWALRPKKSGNNISAVPAARRKN